MASWPSFSTSMASELGKQIQLKPIIFPDILDSSDSGTVSLRVRSNESLFMEGKVSKPAPYLAEPRTPIILAAVSLKSGALSHSENWHINHQNI